MNILVISREIPPVGGGAGNFAWNLASELALQGHRIFIITMHFGNLPKYEEKDSITIYRVPCKRKNQHSSFLLEMLRFIILAKPLAIKIAKEYKCQIIHAHAIIPDGFIAVRAGKAAGIPTVITAHGSDVPGYNPDNFKLAHMLSSPLWRRILNQVNSLIVPSNYLANMILKVKPEQKISIIPYGIDLNKFSSYSKQDTFLICSRLVRRKNFHLFLEALKDISDTQTVHIVGEGPMLNELKELAGKIPQHNIIFHGWLANGSQQWKHLYETCRYFVFTSENENFPVSLMEAQLAGMTILASPIPGNREVLGDYAVYFKGFLVSDIMETLKQLLSGRFEIDNCTNEKAISRIHKNFSWNIIAKKYILEYESVQK